MNIKRILKGFAPDTKIKYFIGDTEIKDISTVEEFLKDGLTSYADTIKPIEIRDNTIIIYQ